MSGIVTVAIVVGLLFNFVASASVGWFVFVKNTRYLFSSCTDCKLSGVSQSL